MPIGEGGARIPAAPIDGDPMTQAAIGAAESGQPTRMLVFLVLTPVSAAVVFAVGLALGVQGPDVTMLGLALVTYVVGLLPIILDIRRPPSARHIFIGLTSIVYMTLYVLPALSYYLPARGPIDAPALSYSRLLPEDVIAGQWVALTGLLALLAGYSSRFSRHIGAALPRARRDWSPNVILIVASVMIPLGWSITLGAALGVVSLEYGGGIIGTLSMSYVYANVLLTVAILRHRSRAALVLLALNVAMLFGLGLLSSEKSLMLVSPALVVLTSTILNGRLRARWILMGFLGLALVYPVSYAVRLETGGRQALGDSLRDPQGVIQLIGEVVSGSKPGEYLGSGIAAAAARNDGLGVTSVIVRDTPSQSPFQYGRTLAPLFIFWIPRALWPSKPPSSIGQWITAVYGSGPHISSSTGPTQLADFYLNFGYFGVIAGMVLVGLIMRIAHETLIRGGATAPGILTVVIMLYYLSVKFMGNVAHVYGQVIFAVTPVFLTHLAVRVFGQDREVSGPDASASSAPTSS